MRSMTTWRMITIQSRHHQDLTRCSPTTKVSPVCVCVLIINIKIIFSGRILLLCGPPGTGKSTTAQLLARRLGYVYYECDTFAQLKNPFIDVHVENPSIAQLKQKILKGISYLTIMS